MIFNSREKKPPNSNPERIPKRENPEKEFLKVFAQLTYRHRPWDVWKDFIVMFSCATSNVVDKSHYDKREVTYMETIKRYNKPEQLLFPKLTAETVMSLEYNPEQDFLGHIFMELNLGNDAGGQFFTPYHVCQCMAAIVIGNIQSEIKKKGYITIYDSCCGAGATLIAGLHEAKKELEKVGLNFQNHVLFAAQDIDYTAALMCYIQLSLLGVAAYVKIGNTLTEPVCPTDTLDNYWFTPIYFSDIWTFRRMFKGGQLWQE